MSLSPKTRLGTYEIVGSLGAGGMGEVYRAKDLRLGRDVAVKVLPAEVASSPERLARFEREARTVAGLNHPNIVTLFSVEDEGDVRFLTMELVEGQTLTDVVAPGGLPLSRVLELSIPLTDALVAAHERGVIHRDLKPGNVMVTRDGRVKVLDFGLAKIAESAAPDQAATLAATAQAPISGEGQVLGTIPYMAPEQLRGETVDARSDLFGLGIMLYELATGRRPFAGDTSIDVGSAILRDAPEPLRSVRADLPEELERIVTRCLEKSPAARFQTALEASNELRALRRALDRSASEKPPTDSVASIAVLPFVNRSRDEEDEYFSDGLADELLNVLAKIRGLRVVARTSSFQFKGSKDDVATIGKKLDVATLLEGSVRKAGNRVRISVQLVSVSDSSHIWSETYDRTLEDIFAVQDDIAQSVVKELRATLLGEAPDSDASGQAKAEVAKAAKGRGTDPEAHRLYLLARYHIARHTREDTAKGVEYLKQALALDPKFALAWAALGRAHAVQGDRGWLPVAEGYRLARESVDRALVLEPGLAEAHDAIGWIQMTYDWNFRGAEVSYARALELAPGDQDVIRGAGVLALTLGRTEESIVLYRQALEKDPLSAAAYMNLGTALYDSDRLGEAEAATRKAIELVPQMVAARAQLAIILLAMGRGEAALAEAAQEPEEAFRLWARAIIHQTMGRAHESDAALRELTEKYGSDSASQIAEAHAARAEVEESFAWLERAYAQRDGGILSLKTSRFVGALRGDPRWSAFLKKMGLEA